MNITILCGLGEYPVELPDGLTVNDLPRMIEGTGGIVVPTKVENELGSKLFIPSSQIQGITWADGGLVGDVTEDLANVSYIEQNDAAEDPVENPKVGDNGEVLIDD